MKRFLVALSVSCLAGNVYAKDLGVYGETTEIREPDLLKSIETKLGHYQKSGQLEEFNQRYANELKRQVTNPNRVTGIIKTEKERYRKFDPTTELEEDIHIPEGDGYKILYAKGIKINPLDYMQFDEPLIFIDGGDQSQVEFAHDYFDQNQKAKIILVNGQPGIKAVRNTEYYHFFDQWGAYSTRFNITKVPSVVTQESSEKVLTIWEVFLS